MDDEAGGKVARPVPLIRLGDAHQLIQDHQSVAGVAAIPEGKEQHARLPAHKYHSGQARGRTNPAHPREA